MSVLPTRIGTSLIVLNIDRSGSMMGVHEEMSAGINEFLAGHTDADAVVVQFDTEYEELYAGTVADAPRYTLKPRGGTALYDAMGRAITEAAEKIADDHVWRQVIVCTVSDGKDTSSKEWSRNAVRDIIAYWRNSFRWQFVFMGCNFDAVGEAVKLGIEEGSALTFDRRRAKESFRLLDEHVSKIRAGHQAAFSATDRRRAIEA
jgi:hypothetical protein